MNYLSHVVSYGETLERIALGVLGTNDISGIIAINNLRYPYISDDPKDQYAHEKGTITLTAALASGANSASIDNVNSLQIDSYDTLFIQDWTTGKYEAVVVSSATSSTINFQSNLSNSYTVAAILTLFSNQENVITKVAKTGDTIYLPANAQLFSANSTDLSNIYGTDIKVDDQFFLAKTDSDLDVSTGIDNVEQAVRLRWSTPYGSLPLDETYGNKMFTLIGESDNVYYWDLTKAYATQCAMADSRVQSVVINGLNATDDTVLVLAEVTPLNSSQSFNVSAAIAVN